MEKFQIEGQSCTFCGKKLYIFVDKLYILVEQLYFLMEFFSFFLCGESLSQIFCQWRKMTNMRYMEVTCMCIINTRGAIGDPVKLFTDRIFDETVRLYLG